MFQHGSTLYKLEKLGLLDDYSPTMVTKMKAVLAMRLLQRQSRRAKFREHRRNGIWEDHLVRLRATGGFQERYKMSDGSQISLAPSI